MVMLLSVHVTRVLFFYTVQYFRPDYGLLLELHTLTLVAHSYALLLTVVHVYVYTACAVYVTIFSTGGKVQLGLVPSYAVLPYKLLYF